MHTLIDFYFLTSAHKWSTFHMNKNYNGFIDSNVFAKIAIECFVCKNEFCLQKLSISKIGTAYSTEEKWRRYDQKKLTTS